MPCAGKNVVFGAVTQGLALLQRIGVCLTLCLLSALLQRMGMHCCSARVIAAAHGFAPHTLVTRVRLMG
jgi:hypothetical protein